MFFFWRYLNRIFNGDSVINALISRHWFLFTTGIFLQCICLLIIWIPFDFVLLGNGYAFFYVFSVLCLQNIERFILVFRFIIFWKISFLLLCFMFYVLIIMSQLTVKTTFFSFYNIYNLVSSFHFPCFGGMLVVVCFNKEPKSLRT